MFSIKRRTFLALLTTGGFVAVGSVLIDCNNAPTDQKSDPLLSPIDSSTGTLSRTHMNILLATVEAITQRENLQGDYEAYFVWRSQNVRGYKDRYERYCELLNRESLAQTKRNFTNNSPSVRLQLINSFRPFLSEKINPKTNNYTEKRFFEFEKFIIQETLHLFAQTDAFLALGYDSFPGQARGFDSYRRLPRLA